MDYDLLESIISAFKQHQLAQKSPQRASIVEFANWIQEQNSSVEIKFHTDQPDIYRRRSMDSEISRLFVRMYRYARILIRTSMRDVPELISEDFTYLYTLMDYEGLTKTELIELNIHEKPTGLEIIRRLQSHRLISEKPDVRDKRSKRIFVTDKGKELFFSNLTITDKIAQIITGKLSAEEKNQLFHILKKLDEFHNPVYKQKDNKSLDALLALVNA